MVCFVRVVFLRSLSRRASLIRRVLTGLKNRSSHATRILTNAQNVWRAKSGREWIEKKMIEMNGMLIDEIDAIIDDSTNDAYNVRWIFFS